MLDRLELTFDLRREDWIEANKACMRESPAWEAAKRSYRRKSLRQALGWSPVCIILMSILIGGGPNTTGMHVEGAIIGAVLAVFLCFALPRLNTVEKTKDARLDRLMRADLSAGTGATTVAIDKHGVRIKNISSEMNFSWELAAPSTAGGFVILQHGQHRGTIIPPRAFTSSITADRFLKQAREWWRAAQLPHAQRLARYLADRDLPCPRCSYNLRGIKSERCPECGEALNLNDLVTNQ